MLSKAWGAVEPTQVSPYEMTIFPPGPQGQWYIQEASLGAPPLGSWGGR